MRWLPLIKGWHPDFPDLDPAWILGLIAQESQGNPYAEDVTGSGSVGLMQVMPRSWTGTKDQLLRPEYNTFVGMRMLHAILEKADGDIRIALAAYNCDWKGIEGATGPEDDRCGAHGGYAYADKILGYWVPVFRAELVVEAANNAWLAELGYLYGMGRWDKEVPQPYDLQCVMENEHPCIL